MFTHSIFFWASVSHLPCSRANALSRGSWEGAWGLQGVVSNPFPCWRLPSHPPVAGILPFRLRSSLTTKMPSFPTSPKPVVHSSSFTLKPPCDMSHPQVASATSWSQFSTKRKGKIPGEIDALLLPLLGCLCLHPQHLGRAPEGITTFWARAFSLWQIKIYPIIQEGAMKGSVVGTC